MVTRDYRPCEKLTWLLSSTGVVELLLHCRSIIVDEKPVDLQVDEARRYRYGVLQRLARSTSSERAVGLGRRMPSMAAAAAAGSTTTSGRSIGAMLTSRFLFSRSRRGQWSLNAGQLHLWFVAQSNTDQQQLLAGRYKSRTLHRLPTPNARYVMWFGAAEVFLSLCVPPTHAHGRSSRRPNVIATVKLQFPLARFFRVFVISQHLLFWTLHWNCMIIWKTFRHNDLWNFMTSFYRLYVSSNFFHRWVTTPS